MEYLELKKIDLYLIIGYLGALLYLISYALLSFKKINGNGKNYILMNLFAASFVAYSCLEHWNGPSFFIQSCWIFFSIVGLIKVYSCHNKKIEGVKKLLKNI